MDNFFKIGHAYLLIGLITLGLASCKVDRVLPSAESVKDISGSWKVIKASRNGTDLIPLIDYSQFRVKFDAKGAYTLVNPLPFVASKDGKYAFDDPNYPFKITFTANGGTPVSTAFNYPVSGGARQLTLTFSPGCTLNNYVYTLVKE
ncbi:DUF5004 domain-containing protein [Mucilaginibacter myungsuensis]|uniref:DUF5004 domain-containing protein n=1 Tax=Mucilaginibacter myungsuensis TaxID=649104 RepID=A0A929L002_9SPHI|nr:DUF5004 domain-containing protein [Mucilaginibacter myungsuensis]MBE9663700.1 DUF5004 domain-containing protein [Mucilaginibacter myungsuensis]MDN3598976.1 DUF5004 domain-containing protein [Mucilaginibacter myungsuensis]